MEQLHTKPPIVRKSRLRIAVRVTGKGRFFFAPLREQQLSVIVLSSEASGHTFAGAVDLRAIPPTKSCQKPASNLKQLLSLPSSARILVARAFDV